MKRAAFVSQIRAIAPQKLVFLDECGFGLALMRLYGWVMGGGRCLEEVPWVKGQNRSVTGAFSLPTFASYSRVPKRDAGAVAEVGRLEQSEFRGVRAGGTLSSSGAGQRVLEPGSVLVLDNARIHHGGQIEALVKKAGCSLLYLPPNSPDFNPIELAWSYIKNLVRSWAPPDDDTREKAIQCAASLLPLHAARNWFKHCGIH